MCGIVGVINKKDSQFTREESVALINDLLHHSQSRGKDSAGIAFVTQNKIQVLKVASAADTLVKTKEYYQGTESNFEGKNEFCAIGHARMETNGSFAKKENNQPIVKDGIVTIHNGIIVNDQELWKKHTDLKRESEVDTEVFNSIFAKELKNGRSLIDALRNSINQLEGSFSFGILLSKYNCLLLATNTGSLYYAVDTPTSQSESNMFFFASEKRFMDKVIDGNILSALDQPPTTSKLLPNKALIVDLETLNRYEIDLTKSTNLDKNLEGFLKPQAVSREVEVLYPKTSTVNIDERVINSDKYKEVEKIINKVYAESKERINKLKRCTRCILPESMPDITFDSEGVCNYCHKYYQPKPKGVADLEKLIAPHRTGSGEPNCIVSFSGGRDSSYALHYVKNELGLNPLAYSYDWGMLTDLGRRNQARMTGQLGVEHILVAADIQKKRSYIRKNLLAWLKKPHIGMIPILMAGDKQYFYHLNKLRTEYKIPLVIYADNALEKTDFKYGFAGVTLPSEVGKAYSIGMGPTVKLLQFYASQYIQNPAYLNGSLIDTFTAYISSYFVPKDYVYLFRHLQWDEKTVEDTILSKYDWETSPDTKSTWRIGDGTASLYNFVYYTIAGLTENDTFRSNQIREGSITREEAIKRSEVDNQPRVDSIIWYCDTVGVDAEYVVKTIASIKRLY